MTQDEWSQSEDYSTPCKHPIKEARLRTLKNKSTAVYDQCLRCGEPTSSAISKLTVTTPIAAFDESLRGTYQQNIQQCIISNQSALDADKKEKESLWWKEYNAYLLTPAWREKRLKTLQRDKYLCQGCLNARAEQVHHLTYEHLFDELLFELESLCIPCHHKCHKDKSQ